MAESQDSANEEFPGTPGIREVRAEPATEKLNIGNRQGGAPNLGIRRVNLRAEIDTSPPFESVKEAVTRFGGSGPWIPLYKLGEAFNSIEDFDIKKVEEEATELEKDLIVKELETLDVLEELGATKRIVEDLKQQLQKEALKCFVTPDVHSHERVGTPVIKEMNRESYGNLFDNQQQIFQSSSPCSVSSPDLILMELKQAKLNLGKTINDLGVIQSSVESLNKKMKKEKYFLERTREKLASKFAAGYTQEKAQEQMDLNPPAAPVETSSPFHNLVNITRSFNSDAGQNNRMVEARSEVSRPMPGFEENGFNIKTAEMRWLAAKKMEEAAMAETRSEVSRPTPGFEENGFNIKTAEMRWLAAKKMEEAAKAAEAIALAEIKALSVGAEKLSGFTLPEPEKVTFPVGDISPLITKAHIPEELTMKKAVDSKLQIDETNISKLNILKKLEEATVEVLHSKQVLTKALNMVETANKKQHAAEEAFRRWIPEEDLKGHAVYNSIKCNKFNPAGNFQDSPLPDVTTPTSVNNGPKPVLRTTVSMRDVLSTKQVPEEYATMKEMEEHTERQKVALSQMLRALRQDLTLPPEVEKNGGDQKQYTQQRKKFGFIQISLPLSKPSKKRA